MVVTKYVLIGYLYVNLNLIILYYRKVNKP